MTFDKFILTVEEQARKYGRKGLKPADNMKTLRIGFTSPDGTFLIGINIVRAAFRGEWRENIQVKELYHQLGGQTPIQTWTRALPDDTILSLYAQVVKAALDRGEGKHTENKS
jgi:hypothetical protein